MFHYHHHLKNILELVIDVKILFFYEKKILFKNIFKINTFG